MPKDPMNDDYTSNDEQIADLKELVTRLRALAAPEETDGEPNAQPDVNDFEEEP